MRAVRRPRRVAALACLFLLSSASCRGGDRAPEPQPSPSRPVQQGGTVRIAAQEPPAFNIDAATDALFWLQQIESGILPSAFRTNPAGRVVLDTELLVSAEVVDADPQVVEYRIRRNASWSDGHPISGRDFAYLWKQCRRAGGPDACASDAGYADIGAVSGAGKVVKVRFSRPFSDWKLLFANILPAHYMEANGGFGRALDTPPRISGGPFILEVHRQGRYLTLERNRRYWGTKAALDRVIFVFEPGDVDVALQAGRIAAAKVDERPSLEYDQLVFNTASGPMADRGARRAVAAALDRRRLAVGGTRLDHHIWMRGQPEYEPHAGALARSDPADAASELERHGITRLRLVTANGDLLRERLADLIAGQLSKAGVEVDITAVPPSELYGSVVPARAFDVALVGGVGSPFAMTAARALYETGGALNHGGFSDEETDGILAAAAAELDRDDYVRLGHQLDERLWDQLPALPLAQRRVTVAYVPTLANVGANPAAEGPLWNVGRWGYAKP